MYIHVAVTSLNLSAKNYFMGLSPPAFEDPLHLLKTPGKTLSLVCLAQVVHHTCVPIPTARLG